MAKRKKESTIRRLARLLKMAILAERYKVPKKAKPKKSETARTKVVTKRLRGAGLTEKEIARFKR